MLGSADGQLAKTSPIYLRLLTGQRLKPKVCFPFWLWTQLPDQVPEMIFCTGVAPLFYHLVEPG